MNKKLKYLPFELFGRLYEGLRFKRLAKDYLPEDFHIRVLCYHDIQEKALPLFEKQIAFLKKEYKIITPEELKNFFLGRGFLPGTNLFITFDDGSADQYQAAAILDKYQIKAAFFVCPEDIEQGIVRSRHGSHLKAMTWQELTDLQSRGHLIGSHSVTHPNLAKLQPTKIYQELKQARTILEGKLNQPINWFAFPYGADQDISDEALLIAKEVYDFNFNFMSGKNHFATADRHFIYRTGVRPDFSLYHLRALMSGLRDL